MPHFLSGVSGSAQLFLSESLADRARLWAGGAKTRLAAYIPHDFRNQLRTYDEIMYLFLGKVPATKSDEFLEKFQGGGNFNPKIYIADFGPLNSAFSGKIAI